MAGHIPTKKLETALDFFIGELEDDFTSPQQSRFQQHMPKVKRDVQDMEEALSGDKSYVRKLITSLKEVLKTGDLHSSALETYAADLVKFGTATSATEPDIGNAFVKFGTLFNQMASLLGNMISSTRSMIFFSLNLLFESELKGAKYKSNINNLYNQYETARNQVEREEKKQMQQMGFNAAEKVFTPEELAPKLVTERRKFQLGTCEYMLKVCDVKMKRGIDLADHLVGYYQGAQANYFRDGNKLLDAMQQWEQRLNTQLSELRAKQEKEKKRLTVVRDKLKQDLGLGMIQGGIEQVDPSLTTDLTQKTGYLAKRPENVLRLPRKQWPKKYCTVSKNGFTMANSHTHAPHVRIPVMLFQFKDGGEVDGRKFCFKLQAQTKAFTFDAESEDELKQWRQVLTNCQLQVFGGSDSVSPSKEGGPRSPTLASDTRDLVKRITKTIRHLPGNDKCCDCHSPDPEWLSVNLGVLICIHCSGRHRELGVQYSRIRSLTLDALKTSELLIARVMGNALLNEVLEANINISRPAPDGSMMEQRREFITQKYIQRKFVDCQIEKSMLVQELLEAVESRDIKHLLQVYAEGVDMATLLPDGKTALHTAIEQEDLTSLHIIDFILANSRSEAVENEQGNTPLHVAALTDNPLCVKLLLNHNASVHSKNKEGKTAIDIAEERKFDDCIEVLQDAVKNKFTKCEHIDIDWGVSASEQDEDIYHTPAELKSGMKRSETADNFLGTSSVAVNGSSGTASAANSPVISRHYVSSSAMASDPLRRPVSTLVDSEYTRSNKSAFTHSSGYPPPTSPAPPPPLRTVSKNAEPLSYPVPPRRKKRISVLPAEINEKTVPQPPPTPQIISIVEALYNCEPDRKDELGFQEGERILVTSKVNSEWWRGYIEHAKSREGLFPVSYVQDVSSQEF